MPGEEEDRVLLLQLLLGGTAWDYDEGCWVAPADGIFRLLNSGLLEHYLDTKGYHNYRPTDAGLKFVEGESND